MLKSSLTPIIHSIIAHLRKNPDTRSLILDLNFIGDQVAIARDLGETLKNTKVMLLCLESYLMSAQDAQNLSLILKGTNVTTLVLSNNPLNLNCTKYLVKALPGTNVTKLYLGDNQIDSLNAPGIGEGLKSTNVTTLICSYNRFNPEGRKILEEILKTNIQRISNERASAFLLIKNRSDQPPSLIDRTKANSYNKLIEWLFPAYKILQKERLDEIQYAGGILFNEDLPIELFEYILSFIPSLQLPARDLNSTSNMRDTKTTVLTRLFDIFTISVSNHKITTEGDYADGAQKSASTSRPRPL